MELLAGNYLREGDVANAATLYTSLENLHPKYSRMARICRVLHSPSSVPLPHRHHDICEALLDPLVQPEILLGDDASMKTIAKRCQNLVIHVHPDKNPSSQAGEAFLRLRSLRDDAVRLLEARNAEEAKRQASRNAVVEAKIKRRNGCRGPAAPSPTAEKDRIHSQLTELKNTRITLRSLKRKDIADDFQIFSEEHLLRRKYGVDIDEVDQRQCRAGRPRPRRPPPRRPGGAQKESLDNSDLKEQANEASNSIDFCKDTGELREVSECTQDMNLSQEGDDMDDIRMQIDAVRADLGRMKKCSTGIRLTCDLSFDAYMREKSS